MKQKINIFGNFRVKGIPALNYASQPLKNLTISIEIPIAVQIDSFNCIDNKNRPVDKKLDELKEKFVQEYGWEKIKGKKIINIYIIDCVFWKSKRIDKIIENIDRVLDIIENNNDILFERWVREKNECK